MSVRMCGEEALNKLAESKVGPQTGRIFLEASGASPLDRVIKGSFQRRRVISASLSVQDRRCGCPVNPEALMPYF